MRLAVTGGRAFANRDFVFYQLDRWHAGKPIGLLIHGGANGADSLAQEWAIERGITYVVFPVTPSEYSEYGRAAPLRRNLRMLIDGAPDDLLAFPGFRGTEHCVQTALKLRIPVTRAGFYIWPGAVNANG